MTRLPDFPSSDVERFTDRVAVMRREWRPSASQPEGDRAAQVDMMRMVLANYRSAQMERSCAAAKWTQAQMMISLGKARVGTELPFKRAFVNAGSRATALLRIAGGIQKDLFEDYGCLLPLLWADRHVEA